MLVGQHHQREIVRAIRQAGRAHVALRQLVIDAALARLGQHRRREVEPVEPPHAARAQPDADPPGAAGEVEHAARGRPVDLGEAIEQPQVHLVLHHVVVGGSPRVVALAHAERGVVPGVERLELHEGLSRCA